MPWPDPADDWDDDEPTSTEPPDLEVDITEPQVLGELYGPNGELMWVLLDRRSIPFGYQPREVEEC